MNTVKTDMHNCFNVLTHETKAQQNSTVRSDPDQLTIEDSIVQAYHQISNAVLHTEPAEHSKTIARLLTTGGPTLKMKSMLRVRVPKRPWAVDFHRRPLSSNPRPYLDLPQDAEDRIIDVTNIAMNMRISSREYAANNTIKLVGILAHDGPYRDDAEVYSELIGNIFMEDGIQYEVARVMGPRPQDMEAAIREANNRPDVHGIMVYYPIFVRREQVRGPYKNRLTGVYYKSHDDYLRDLVSAEKDVEGLCQAYNARWLLRDRIAADVRDSIDTFPVPCTALSVVKILDALEERLDGLTISIINRSEIMGRPLAAILSRRGAYVYSIDIDSILQFRPGGRLRRVTDMTLEKCLQASSIVVSGVPTQAFKLPCHSIMPGSLVVNVSEFENVPLEPILEVPGVRFVPHVGKVTIAALQQNLINLHRTFN